MTQPLSPLRQRMIDDMTIRNMTPGTQKSLRPTATARMGSQAARISAPSPASPSHCISYRVARSTAVLKSP
jgi:hypothetical protein